MITLAEKIASSVKVESGFLSTQLTNQLSELIGYCETENLGCDLDSLTKVLDSFEPQNIKTFRANNSSFLSGELNNWNTQGKAMITKALNVYFSDQR